MLLCNYIYADATLAKYDEEYEIIDNLGVTNEENLDLYSKFKRERELELDKIKFEIKAPKYSLRSDNYIFRKIK